ncbi:hypothetical protein, partial [Tateyamaria sp.]|uniref:hypothetical protein n=1 Tax=Tateyamaria sp. TaxID=1929288 RepID=UPI00329BA148
PQQHTEEMLGMEDTSRGLPRKDAGGDGQQPLPSEAIGVAVQVSLTVLISTTIESLKTSLLCKSVEQIHRSTL